MFYFKGYYSSMFNLFPLLMGKNQCQGIIMMVSGCHHKVFKRKDFCSFQKKKLINLSHISNTITSIVLHWNLNNFTMQLNFLNVAITFQNILGAKTCSYCVIKKMKMKFYKYLLMLIFQIFKKFIVQQLLNATSNYTYDISSCIKCGIPR